MDAHTISELRNVFRALTDMICTLLPVETSPTSTVPTARGETPVGLDTPVAHPEGTPETLAVKAGEHSSPRSLDDSEQLLVKDIPTKSNNQSGVDVQTTPKANELLEFQSQELSHPGLPHEVLPFKSDRGSFDLEIVAKQESLESSRPLFVPENHTSNSLETSRGVIPVFSDAQVSIQDLLIRADDISLREIETRLAVLEAIPDPATLPLPTTFEEATIALQEAEAFQMNAEKLANVANIWEMKENARLVGSSWSTKASTLEKLKRDLNPEFQTWLDSIHPTELRKQKGVHRSNFKAMTKSPEVYGAECGFSHEYLFNNLDWENPPFRSMREDEEESTYSQLYRNHQMSFEVTFRGRGKNKQVDGFIRTFYLPNDGELVRKAFSVTYAPMDGIMMSDKSQYSVSIQSNPGALVSEMSKLGSSLSDGIEFCKKYGLSPKWFANTCDDNYNTKFKSSVYYDIVSGLVTTTIESETKTVSDWKFWEGTPEEAFTKIAVLESARRWATGDHESCLLLISDLGFTDQEFLELLQEATFQETLKTLSKIA